MVRRVKRRVQGLRLGEPPHYARGIHRLPRKVVEPFEQALVRSLDPGELRRALAFATELFLREVGEAERSSRSASGFRFAKTDELELLRRRARPDDAFSCPRGSRLRPRLRSAVAAGSAP